MCFSRLLFVPALSSCTVPFGAFPVRSCELALQEGSVLAQTPAQVRVRVRELAPGRERERVMVRARVAPSLEYPPAPPRAP